MFVASASNKKSVAPQRESHTKHLEISVSYFFLHDCFGIVVPKNKHIQFYEMDVFIDNIYIYSKFAKTIFTRIHGFNTRFFTYFCIKMQIETI